MNYCGNGGSQRVDFSQGRNGTAASPGFSIARNHATPRPRSLRVLAGTDDLPEGFSGHQQRDAEKE